MLITRSYKENRQQYRFLLSKVNDCKVGRDKLDYEQRYHLMYLSANHFVYQSYILGTIMIRHRF